MIRPEVFALAASVGFCIYLMRVLPFLLGGHAQSGKMARFFAATGVAAIAALAAAGIMPNLIGGAFWPTVAGCAGVIGIYAASRSVVGATVIGAAIYGISFAYL